MPRVQLNEAPARRLARDLRDLKQRFRGLSIHSDDEAAALREALAELNGYVEVAIAVRVKQAADA